MLFFYAFVYRRVSFFLSLFTSLVSCVVLYPPQDQEVGGTDGKIDAGVDSVPGDGVISASLCRGCYHGGMFCMEHGEWTHGYQNKQYKQDYQNNLVAVL